MKKIMIMACAVALASVVNAATCTWGSGALKTAASAEGGWSGTGVNTAGALVTMSVYLIDAATYESLASASQQELFDAYSTKTADLTGVNKNASGTVIGAVAIKDTDSFAGVEYAVVIAQYTDAAYGDMYMATTKATTFNSATSAGSANAIFSGSGMANWQAAAVPEPTSGLLLLLGMAGLALRRKQA